MLLTSCRSLPSPRIFLETNPGVISCDSKDILSRKKPFHLIFEISARSVSLNPSFEYPWGITLTHLPVLIYILCQYSPKVYSYQVNATILRAKTCEQTEFTISSLRSSLHISILQFSNHYRSHIRIRVLSPRIYAYIYRYIFFDKIVHTKYVFAEREGEYHDPDVRYRLSFVRYRTATEQSLT